LQVRNGHFVEVRPGDRSGPPEAPDFWDTSVLMDWWDYFCGHKQYYRATYRNEIDQFVTSC